MATVNSVRQAPQLALRYSGACDIELFRTQRRNSTVPVLGIWQLQSRVSDVCTQLWSYLSVRGWGHTYRLVSYCWEQEADAGPEWSSTLVGGTYGGRIQGWPAKAGPEALLKKGFQAVGKACMETRSKLLIWTFQLALLWFMWVGLPGSSYPFIKWQLIFSA